ncbi:hypothetical protein MBAV_002611, partial [Candidatus Magnetobacterium bavaricum]
IEVCRQIAVVDGALNDREIDGLGRVAQALGCEPWIGEDLSMLVKGCQRLSEASFHKIWDNQEDAVYDSL